MIRIVARFIVQVFNPNGIVSQSPGLRLAATLGYFPQKILPTPTGLLTWHRRGLDSHTISCNTSQSLKINCKIESLGVPLIKSPDTTPLGLEVLMVAATQGRNESFQPWALGRNPVGIEDFNHYRCTITVRYGILRDKFIQSVNIDLLFL